MAKLKEASSKHMETIIVVSVLVGSVLGVFMIVEKTVMLNFYYLPVLIAGYFLGRRHAVLAAIFCVLATIFYALLYPEMFAGTGKQKLRVFSMLSAWGGFLILVTLVASYLFEVNQKRIRELREAYIGVLEILTKYLESKDEYTKGHSLRVAELAAETAKTMGLSEDEVEVVRAAAMLHDIGKVEVSASVISKAAGLTAEEPKQMDSHSQKGAELLESVGVVLRNAVPLILAHHNYFAHGDSDPDVPLGACIIAVADSFDAMTTDRPYRKAIPMWEALEEIKQNAGTQFDPTVVEAFEKVAAAKVEAM